MNNIQKIIDENNILVIHEDIKKEYQINGLYINIMNRPTIILNKSLYGQQEELTLAEEVAHYCVGVTPTLPLADDYYNQLIRSKNEFKAFKWMQDKLIPYDMQKYKYDTLWEISEDLGMPPEFIQKAIEYRKENFDG